MKWLKLHEIMVLDQFQKHVSKISNVNSGLELNDCINLLCYLEFGYCNI